MPDPAPRPQDLPRTSSISTADRVGAAFEVLLCSGLPTQLVIVAALTAAGMPPRDADGLLSPAFVFLLSLLDTGLVVALVVLLLRAGGESPRAVLVGRRRVGAEALLGVAILPVLLVGILALLALVLTLAPGLHNVPRNPFEDMLRTREDAVVFGIVAVLAGGVREEVQRGFILHRFDRFLGGGWTGLAAFSLLFGLGHLEQGYDVALATALLGAVWGALFLVRRSIVAPMVSHAGFNIAQLLKHAAFVG